MRTALLIALAAAIIATTSVAVCADTTSQTWGFVTNSNPAAPEVVSNAFGTPSATINFEEPFGTGWYDTMPELYGSEQGWWDIGPGSVLLSIPNSPTGGADLPKDVQIEVKYWSDLSSVPSVSVDGNALTSELSTLVEEGPLGGGWYVDRWSMHLTKNPDQTTVEILGDAAWGSQIGEVAVTTSYAAVPEPGALLSLCTGVCGLMGFISRRRRA